MREVFTARTYFTSMFPKVTGHNIELHLDSSYIDQNNYANSQFVANSITTIPELGVNSKDEILEVSTAASDPFGRSLSAHNVKLSGIHLEIIYHTSKRYEGGAPDLRVTPRGSNTSILTFPGIKDRSREAAKHLGPRTGYEYEGEFWDLTAPRTAFFDFVYVKSFLSNFRGSLPLTLDKLSQYKGFTDVFFNPITGSACQARSVALITCLHREGLLHNNYTKDSWLDIYPKYMESDADFAAKVEVSKTIIGKYEANGTKVQNT